MKIIFTYSLLLCFQLALAQHSESNISFVFQFQNDKLELNRNYVADRLKTTVAIQALKFYISNLRFYENDVYIDHHPKIYHLVDMEDSSSWHLIYTSSKSFNKIVFNLGIDSATNGSGVMPGDLDPQHGMYWTWQSGYINFKLEGVSPVCKTRKNQFQFHLGGYLHPFYSLQKIELNVDSKKSTRVIIPLDKIIEKIDISKLHEVMSPSENAVEISKIIAHSFYVE